MHVRTEPNRTEPNPIQQLFKWFFSSFNLSLFSCFFLWLNVSCIMCWDSYYQSDSFECDSGKYKPIRLNHPVYYIFSLSFSLAILMMKVVIYALFSGSKTDIFPLFNANTVSLFLNANCFQCFQIHSPKSFAFSYSFSTVFFPSDQHSFYSSRAPYYSYTLIFCALRIATFERIVFGALCLSTQNIARENKKKNKRTQ